MKPTFSPLLLSVTLFAFLFALGSWFFVIPDFRQLTQDNKTIDSYVPTAASKASAATAQLQQIASTKNTAETLLPLDDHEYDLSVQVEALCKNVGVTITNMSFTAADTLPKTTGVAVAAPVSTAPSLALSLAVSGTYAQIQQLTSGIVSLNRFVQLTQVTLSGQQTATGGQTNSVSGGVVLADLVASAYYLPSTTATPTPTPAP